MTKVGLSFSCLPFLDWYIISKMFVLPSVLPHNGRHELVLKVKVMIMQNCTSSFGSPGLTDVTGPVH